MIKDIMAWFVVGLIWLAILGGSMKGFWRPLETYIVYGLGIFAILIGIWMKE